MICFRFISLLVYVLPKLSEGVKVNMQGSISLGKDVVETLSRMVNEKNGRRSLTDGDENDDAHGDSDTIALIVNSAFLCRDLNFCQGDVGILVNKYIILLAKAVESVFEGLIVDDDKKQNDQVMKAVIFEDDLRKLIFDIKKLLENTNKKISDENEAFMWIDLIKRINAKFQDQAIVFAGQRLEGTVQEIADLKKKLTQKLVADTTLAELRFESKLCLEYSVCTRSYECTSALNTFLEKITFISDERVKEFFRYFYETLPNTNFFYRLSDVTAREFQSILYEMAYTDNILTKNILMIVHKTVGNRLNVVSSKFKATNNAIGRDVKLVHIILSDVDHIYNSKQKKDPFHDFFGDFFDWKKEGGHFATPLRRLMKDIQNVFSYGSDELVLKLVNEVKVFMEITVDP